MRIFRAALFTALILSPAAVGAYDLHYTIEFPEPGNRNLRVAIEVTGFPSNVDSLRFRMVERYAYVRLDEPLLDGPVTARSPESRVPAVIRTGPNGWIAAPAGLAAFSLHYTVPLIHRELPEVVGRDEYEQPYLTRTHGLLATGAIFMVPSEMEPESIRLKVDAPDSWPAICPWPEIEPHVFRIPGCESLLDNLIIAGDWSVHEMEFEGFQAAIAFAPGQEATERVALPVVKQIIETELELFGMRPQARYLFCFTEPESPGFSGSPKKDAMALAIAAENGEEPPLDAMAPLLAHEFHHTWIHVRFDAPGELRFYHEGFTDYYAFLVCARLGLISWEQYAKELGHWMRICVENPLAGRTSLADAGEELFFEDPDASALIYKGGLLVAALLDREIRAMDEGLSLDDFMRAFNNDSRWSLENAPALADWFDLLTDCLGAERADRFRTLVTEPFALDPVREFNRLGVKVEEKRSLFRRELRYEVDPEPWRLHQATEIRDRTGATGCRPSRPIPER